MLSDSGHASNLWEIEVERVFARFVFEVA